jgi:hypothetical protein
MTTENKYTFAFFPYLKTSNPIQYRGLVIKNSEDASGMSPEAVRHLETLRAMFFLRDHVRIKEVSYTFHVSARERVGVSEFLVSALRRADVSEFVKKLLEFQALLSYIYSSPHPTFGDPFLQYEHASLYLLQPERVVKYSLWNEHNVEILPEALCLEFDTREEIEGYEGNLNNRTSFYVTKSSRIFPPAAHLWLNISQDLHVDLKIGRAHV